MTDGTFSGKPLVRGAAQEVHDSLPELPIKPWHTHVGMSDQEIRARALECASRCYVGRDTTEQDVLLTALEFEAYIKTG